MTGSPLTRLVLVAAAFAVLGWVLATNAPNRPEAAPSPVEAREPAPTTEVEFSFESPVAPEMVEVLYLGEEIATSRGEKSFSIPAELSLDPDGADVVVRAIWADNSPQAVRVQTTIRGSRHSDQTLWGEGEIEEAVAIPATQ